MQKCHVPNLVHLTEAPTGVIAHDATHGRSDNAHSEGAPNLSGRGPRLWRFRLSVGLLDGVYEAVPGGAAEDVRSFVGVLGVAHSNVAGGKGGDLDALVPASAVGGLPPAGGGAIHSACHLFLLGELADHFQGIGRREGDVCGGVVEGQPVAGDVLRRLNVDVSE
jgi:hypothetical protein